MYKDLFKEIGVQVEALGIDCEREEVYYKTMITTHEVTIGQQSIQLKKAQEVVEDNLNTILRLQGERDSLFNALIVLDPGYVPDFYTLLHNVPVDVQEEYNPVPYPYTHPIRETGAYSKVREPR